MAAVTAAAVAATGMTVIVIVVVATNTGVIHQLTGKQRLHSLISITGNTAKQLDTCLLQRHLRAATNAAANEHIDALFLKETREFYALERLWGDAPEIEWDI